MTNEPEPNTRAREALKPCPLCTGEAMAQEDHWRDGNLRGGEPFCKKCGLKMPRYWPRREAEAITAWNTRPLTQPSELVAWLIERRVTPPQWSSESNPTGVGAFYSDPNRAHRFSTKVEAEKAMRRMSITQEERGQYFVSEHLWVGSAVSDLSDFTPLTNSALRAQIAKLQADGDKLAGALEKRAFIMSERHLSGARVCIGFETFDDAFAAHMAFEEWFTKWKDRA